MASRLFVVGGGLVALGGLAWLPLAACGTSSSSGGVGTDDGGASGATACVYSARVSYDCPGFPTSTSPWETDCRGGVDCTTVAGTSGTVSGCTQRGEVQGVAPTPGTCTQLGGTLAAGDASVYVLDAGGAAVPCYPLGDAGAFAPSWHPPRVGKGSCTQAQIDSFRQCVDAVDNSATPASCVPWSHPTGADQTCLSCLESSPGDAQWGPLVVLPTETLINVPGCLAIAEGQLDGTGCGGALAASQACGRAVCVPQCPAGSSVPATAAAERVEEQACERLSEPGACAAYTKPAECAGAMVTGDAGTTAEKACLGLPAQTQDAVFEAVALAFCGP